MTICYIVVVHLIFFFFSWEIDVNSTELGIGHTPRRPSIHTKHTQKLLDTSLVYNYLLKSLPLIATPRISMCDIVFGACTDP